MAVSYQVIQAEIADWLAQCEGPRFHAVLSDPPYGLAFMGKRWDKFKSPQAYQKWVESWAGLLIEKALLPGAVGLFCGGARTFHRLFCGLEDAGFEVADTLMWLYGSGFPKGLNISKAIDKAAGVEREMVGYQEQYRGQTIAIGGRGIYGGLSKPSDRKITAPATPEAACWEGWGTALKPAYEPIALARAPRGRYTFAQLALEFGTGALWIDGCRIPVGNDYPNGFGGPRYKASSSPFGRLQLRPWVTRAMIEGRAIKHSKPHPQGRWPANVILDEETAKMLDEMSGILTSGRIAQFIEGGQFIVYGKHYPRWVEWDGDSGGASRFFYCAKASRREREAGLESWPEQKKVGRKKVSNLHPTVKPLKLTEYLARLLLPPKLNKPRRILVPFAGSGSEVVGALRAGWDEVMGIEIDPDYCRIAEKRIEYWLGQKI